MKRFVGTVVVGFALATLVTGCASSDDGAKAPAPASAGTAAASVASEDPAAPVASSLPTPTARPVSIPTACTDLVDPATYAATMGDAPLNDPEYFTDPMGEVVPTPPAADADPREVVSAAGVLRCGWADVRADITGLFVFVSEVDATAAASYPTWLTEKRESTSPFWLDGVVYDCSHAYGGTVCQYTTTHPMYGVDMADTVLVRDDVVVTVTQRNVPTDDLMGSIVTRLWG